MIDKEILKEILDQAAALQEAIKFIYQHDADNMWRFSGYKTFLRKYNFLVTKLSTHLPLDGLLDIYNIEKIPGPLDTLASTQKELFDGVLANISLLISLLSSKLHIQDDEIQNLKNFLESKLRKAILQEPQKELDIQNAIEQLLIGRGLSKGIDYDRESGRVKVSLKEVIPDFIFMKLNLAMEIKFSTSLGKTKSIIDEINADIMSYSKGYKNIYFVIYDKGTIRDENEFKNDLDNSVNIIVSIIKH